MSNVQTFLLFIMLTGLSSAGIALFMARRGRASLLSVLLIAPLPLPGLIGGLCFFFLVRTLYFLSARSPICDVRACVVDVRYALVSLLCAGIAYGIGLAIAWIVLRWAGARRQGISLDDVFE